MTACSHLKCWENILDSKGDKQTNVFKESRMLHPKIQHVTICLSILSFGVQSELICSDQPIVALDGDDVILPCHLQPPVSVTSVLWTKPGLDPKYIHDHRDGRLVYQDLNPSYYSRTILFVDQLLNGNVSLKIFNVKLSDAGKYFCILPSMQKEASIQLIVGVVSWPVIEIILKNDAEVVLHCRSEGWYPEPEVSWLDGEGHVLSAGPTETVRGPDGLYTVSSTVTMKRRNIFICRVQQKDINQTRETQIHVPDYLRNYGSLFWLQITILVLAFVNTLLMFLMMMKICNKRKRETVIHSFKDLLKKDENNSQTDSLKFSRLTGPKTEPENQRTTGEDGQSAEQQTESQEEETTD